MLEEVVVQVRGKGKHSEIVVWVLAELGDEGQVGAKVVLVDSGVDSIKLFLILFAYFFHHSLSVFLEDFVQVRLANFFLEIDPYFAEFGFFAHIIIARKR